jgi:amidase
MDWDVFLCPVARTPAFAHDSANAPWPSTINWLVDYSVAGSAYGTPFSLTGHPVVVVPIARAANGLPIGIQIVGGRWCDMRVLTIAAATMAVLPSSRDPPGGRVVSQHRP